MTVEKGILTYDAEGMEGGKYHSRVLHVPSANSGLTIGRGYDMNEKEASKIKSDLIKASVDEAHATMLSTAAHLKGDAAKQFIEENNLGDFEISIAEQEALFDGIYSELESDVIRICNKADCVPAYGVVNWDALEDKIKEVAVNLRFRGDYHSTSRKLIQKHIADNDLEAFSGKMMDKDNWSGVLEDRFNRRVAFITS